MQNSFSRVEFNKVIKSTNKEENWKIGFGNSNGLDSWWLWIHFLGMETLGLNLKALVCLLTYVLCAFNLLDRHFKP